MYSTGWTLIYDMALFGFLTWYFDNTIAVNRGVGKPWNFCCLPSFWCPNKRGKNSKKINYDLDAVKMSKNVSINTAIAEKQNIMKLENDGKIENIDGIRVLGLTKSYKSIVSGEKNEALKNVFFELKKGELLGVMGHNGAGKSTLINTICGIVNKDSGNARIYDANIEEDLVKVRKRMGIVS